jgi:hypothetical protein
VTLVTIRPDRRATPSGWDIALVLMGHMDITPSGPVRQPGLLIPADPRKPMVLSLRPFAGSAANYRSLMRGLTHGSPVTLADPPRSGSPRSMSAIPRWTSCARQSCVCSR